MKVVYHCLEDIRHKSTTGSRKLVQFPARCITWACDCGHHFIPLSKKDFYVGVSHTELCLVHSDNVIGEKCPLLKTQDVFDLWESNILNRCSWDFSFHQQLLSTENCQWNIHRLKEMRWGKKKPNSILTELRECLFRLYKNSRIWYFPLLCSCYYLQDLLQDAYDVVQRDMDAVSVNR